MAIMPIGLLPNTVAGRVYTAIKRRIQYYAEPQLTSLAVRLTETTPGAQRCPTCWDSFRNIVTDPGDPTCLGVGWIIPSLNGAPTAAGYIPPVPFDCVVVPGKTDYVQMLGGIVEYSGEYVCIFPPGQQVPKKDDVLIVTTPSLPNTERYVVADVQTPDALGYQTFIYVASLEKRQADNPIFSIPPADPLGVPPGAWG